MRSRLMFWILMNLSPCAVLAADEPIIEREQLNSVLWMQTAPEYRMVATQTYAAATAMLDENAKKPCAAWEQSEESPSTCANRRLRPAVVLDVDETVLDNSFFQSRLLRDGQGFTDAEWGKWVAEKKARDIPGAISFVKAALKKGYEVFFITNRACQSHAGRADLIDRYYDSSGRALLCPQKADTMAVMESLGFPRVAADHFLFGHELHVRSDAAAETDKDKKSWETRKDRRRRFIFQNFPVRIVMLLGDDLRDFVDRDVWGQNEQKLLPFVGSQWFALPNAMYGSWEIRAAGTGCRESKLQNPSESCARLRVQSKYTQLNDARE